MNNLFFLGGPHGSGKTTLVELLEKADSRILVPEIYTRTPKFYSDSVNGDVNFFHRQVLKHAQRAIENYEYLDIARKNPDKIVLGNRCFYDVLAYHEAYFKRGWMNEEEESVLISGLIHLFPGELAEPNIIVLNPGFEVCKRHLKMRWETKKKKFMEDDMDYLRTACESYERFRYYENVLYINHEIDLKNSYDIDRIGEWMEEVKNGEKIIEKIGDEELVYN